MSQGAQGTSRLAYPVTMAMLALALAFPIALMVLNPTLMFERGWEQYVGTAIYLWAVVTLGRELLRLRKDERAFDDAPALLDALARAKPANDDDRRLLPGRLRQLARHASGPSAPTVEQLMELNREGSGLDQEQATGRFTITRYILYLLPVIGFIGTVEGISKALMNISRVLPMVKDLDGFLNNLTSVTSALQIAFDSTLLALFLSAALMLVQTLVFRRAEDLLARVDRWVVDHALPKLGRADGEAIAALPAVLADLRRDLLVLGERMGAGLGPHVARFSEAVDRLDPALASLQRGAEAIGRVGDDLKAVGESNDLLRRGVATLGRIESALAQDRGPDEQLEQIRRGVERSCAATEALAGQWSQAFERTSRLTQEQLARTLHSLKDALDLLQVSMEQGNALYRSIVKKILPVYHGDDESDARAA
ncbi:MAG TPA: MotA/TolQ/ExbB proton channel family protein [Isosphaeraceae bacterium]|jgi:biopolymer transport protein ExbB/TolQ|nr:MotA/TolQ/ExbB proton channel family protein [Isosphaeraceae bacterium]